MELDLEQFRKEFEETYKEEETTETEETTEETETEVETQTEETQTEEETTETETETEETTKTQTEPKKQTKEDNAAFAQMRKQNEALQRQAAIVEKAAARNGMTVDQYLQAVADQEEAERAEEQKIPVEVLRRLEAAESQLSHQTVQSAQDKYLAEVRLVTEKLGITDAEADTVFKFIGENGYFNPETKTPIISFEQAYKLANFDTLLERKVKESNQKRLTEKQARQKNTALPHTNASTTSTEGLTDEITDDFVLKRLKERNLLF